MASTKLRRSGSRCRIARRAEVSITISEADRLIVSEDLFGPPAVEHGQTGAVFGDFL